jgi:hypothetical protein
MLRTANRLFSFIKQYWKDTIWTWFFVLVESVCEVLVVLLYVSI